MMAGTRERIRPNTKATFREASQAMNIALNPNYHTEHSAFEIKLAGPLSSRFDISPDLNKTFYQQAMKLNSRDNMSNLIKNAITHS